MDTLPYRVPPPSKLYCEIKRIPVLFRVPFVWDNKVALWVRTGRNLGGNPCRSETICFGWRASVLQLFGIRKVRRQPEETHKREKVVGRQRARGSLLMFPPRAWCGKLALWIVDRYTLPLLMQTVQGAYKLFDLTDGSGVFSQPEDQSCPSEHPLSFPICICMLADFARKSQI